MRIVFMGTPEFSVPILETLAQHTDVVLVVSQPAGGAAKPSPVFRAASRLKLECLRPQRVRDVQERIAAVEPDFIITAAYGQILPRTILDVPKIAPLNVHASLLPKLRGGAPVQRAIERRHEQSGISIIEMVEKMDAGGIYAQRAIDIEADETSTSLFEKLALLGRDLLLDTLPSIASGTLSPVSQNDDEATFAYNVKPHEEHLDFNRAADDVEAKIRALNDVPGPYVLLPDRTRLKIRLASRSDKDETEVPGTFLAADRRGMHIQCADGTVLFTAVQPEGKKTMSATAFMNGRGRHLLKPGVVLT